MCYYKHHNVEFFIHKFVLTDGMTLAISKHDMLRCLGILFMPFASSVRNTKYHKQCSASCLLSKLIIYTWVFDKLG